MHSLKHVALLISIQLIINATLPAQSTSATKIQSLFLHFGQLPQVYHLKPAGIYTPKGGHLQGVQRFSDSLLFLTASSGSYSYYLIGELNSRSAQLNSIHKITDSPYRHAGGCQLWEDKLVVGVEDNRKKNSSDVLMVSLSKTGHETGRRVIAHRSGIIKRSTAGAVGFTKIKTGQYLVVVGDWDSDYFDVYLSKPGIDSLFDSVTTFSLPVKGKLPSYQSINLFTDTAGKIYLLGFSRFNTRNRVDLYQLDLQKNALRVTNLQTQYYHCKGGAGFRYGSGINIQNDHITIYACSRGTRPFTTINIFYENKNANLN